MKLQKPNLVEPPTDVVLVDRHGKITDVQLAVRPSAAKSAPRARTWKAGDAYLAHCEGEQQRAVIQALLDGKRSLISLVVPPTPPEKKDWLVVVGAPIGSDPGAGAILMHIEITASVLHKNATDEASRGQKKPEKLSASLVQSTFSEALARKLGETPERLSSPHPDVESLSPRQREVLLLIAAGKNNLEIAEDLSCSLNTVKRHVTAVLQKLRLPNRTRAAMLAAELNLLPRNVRPPYS